MSRFICIEDNVEVDANVQGAVVLFCPVCNNPLTKDGEE